MKLHALASKVHIYTSNNSLELLAVEVVKVVYKLSVYSVLFLEAFLFFLCAVDSYCHHK